MDYDSLYDNTLNYFGNPFPEVLKFFESRETMESVLDVGCGQGRNALPLSKMGFKVRAIDTSAVAIDQLSKKADNDNLAAECLDLMEVANLEHFDFVLLDGFFHFYDHDVKKEKEQFQFILNSMGREAQLVICFAKHGDSLEKFDKMTAELKRVYQEDISYEYVDPITELRFETKYSLVVLGK
ncbi:MAG: methyltransferase domain-containing protein [Bacteroidota bacterium]